ncbi:hypothetical protein LLH00_14060, partial [bacterium]|nr:hypothetical protein [bacterium]
MRPGKSLFLVLCVCVLVARNLAALEIPLTAREWQGLARRAEVVSTGLPLPRGAVHDPVSLGLLDGSGKAVPAQFLTQAVWPDGSVKWLLLTFPADCAPKTEARYTLTDKASTPVGTSPLAVREEGGKVIVETGVLKAELDREYFDLFGRVWLDHNRDGVFTDSELVTTPENPEGIAAVDAQGRRLASRWGKVDSLVVEERGPVRATVLVKGSLFEYESYRRGDPWVDYTARLQFHAGSGLVRVFFSLEN